MESAVSALENELAGKASGGSSSTSLETCVIEIINGEQSISKACIGYVSVEQNQIITKSIDLISGTSISITCLCNSLIGIKSWGEVSSPYLQKLNVSISGLILYEITAARDTTFSITLTEGGGNLG